MYEAMNTFLAPETWHTTHPLDRRRFFDALNEIVWRPDFDAEAMAEYIRTRVAPDVYEDDIDRLQREAEVIHNFLVSAGRV